MAASTIIEGVEKNRNGHYQTKETSQQITKELSESAVLILLVVIISYLVLEAFLGHVRECCCHIPCLKSDRQTFYTIAPRETCVTVAVCVLSCLSNSLTIVMTFLHMSHKMGLAWLYIL